MYEALSNVYMRELIRGLSGSENLERLELYRYNSAESCDSETIQALAFAIQSMVMLESLALFNVMPNAVEDWALFGRSLANCARLNDIESRTNETPSGGDAIKTFIRELGFPPRLSSYFSLGDPEIEEPFLEALESDRAKCLTALLCGATLERVGGQSTCWRIPRDIFRRLHAFLPCYNNQVLLIS